MSYARNQRRRQARMQQACTRTLAGLLGDFYEFLAGSPQPTDEEVRNLFITSDQKWRRYCHHHELMNMDNLFVTNVREAWRRHASLPQPKADR